MNNYVKYIVITLLTGVFMVANAEVNPSAIKATIANFKDNPKVAPYFDQAYGYAVFPNVTKGGLIIGFGEGDGEVFKQGEDVGSSKMTQFSIGAQLGAQTYSQVIFFEDAKAYNNFLAQGTTFAANASAAFITLGANAQAGSGGVSSSASTGQMAENVDPKMHGVYSNSIASFMLTKAGLMVQATLGGETYNFTPN